MNIDIRKSIKNNFKDSNKEDIYESINLSIQDKDEITLPGMGVFFEIVWENANEELKDKIINILLENLKNQG